MKKSLLGHLLPETVDDYLGSYDAMKYKVCMDCGAGFSKDNVTTAAGWCETQISGYCEKCFDKLFAYMDEEEDDGQP